MNRVLWENSGHWDHYKENMYFTRIDEQDYAIKPMNCPGAMLIYKTRIHSYRDLPIRMGELGLVHRHELSGTLHGMMRVRSFTQDDAHIFVLPSQIKDEVKGVIDLTEKIYSVSRSGLPFGAFNTAGEVHGFRGNVETATATLRECWKKGHPYVINEGDGALRPENDFT